jgi:sulfite reductase alpha subunit-like flavoprotein
LLRCLGEDPSRLVSVAALDQVPSDKPAAAAASRGAGPPQHLVKSGPVTLRELVARSVDLRSQPKKALLRMLADYAADQAEADELYLLSCIKGKDRFRTEIEDECLSVVELLERFPSARPPPALLLQMLPALSPRYYSIASSPLVLPSRVRIAFSVVSWTTPKGRKREGLCTNWLHRLCQAWTSSAEHAAWAARVSSADATNSPGPEFSIFVAPSKGFKLPEDPERRIIMVGPGTGVAPFVGFIQHRNTLAEERRAEQASRLVKPHCLFRPILHMRLSPPTQTPPTDAPFATLNHQAAMGDRCMGYWRGMSLQVPDERIEQAPMGAMKLFFGCRRSDEDFLYRDELLQFHEQGECGWTADQLVLRLLCM